MSLSEDQDHSISLEEAAKLTKSYREEAGTGAIIATAFGKTALIDILEQDDCIGIRAYYAKREDGTPCLVLVGVNADGNDITDGKIAEWSADCPPHCSESNKLNS